MITAVVVMAMVVVSGVLLNDVVIHTRMVDSYEQNYQLRYAADSGLEQVKYQVATNSTWLANNSSAAGFLAFNNLMVGTMTVDVMIYNLGNNLYRVDSTAQATVGNQPVTYALAMNIKVEPPSIYTPSDVFYVDPVQGGTVATTSKQDIYGSVWASSGVYPTLVSSWSLYAANTYFYNDVASGGSINSASLFSYLGAVNPYAPARPTIDTTTLQNQAQSSANTQSGAYYIHPDNPLYQTVFNRHNEWDDGWYVVQDMVDVKIKLLGNQIAITATSVSSGATVSGVYPLPDNNLIYVNPGLNPNVTPEGNEIWIEGGTLNGRLAIFGARMYITDSIRYVDNEDDPAYILTKNSVPVSTDTPVGVAWTAAAGYQYTNNPAYNPQTPSNLHLIGNAHWGGWSGTRGSAVYIKSGGPYNMEVHATILGASLSGGNMQRTSRTLPWSIYPAQSYGNLRVVGAITGNADTIWSLRGAWGLHNGFMYDSALATNAPEWSPSSGGNTTYTFNAWRRQ